MHTPAPNGILIATLCCGIIAVALWDFRYRKIPNGLLFVIMAAGLAHAALAGGHRGAVASLFGAAAGIVLLVWPCDRGLVSIRDVKLLSAIGMWVGVAGAVRILVMSAIIGGFLACAVLVRLPREHRAEVRRNIATFARTGSFFLSPQELDDARVIPFGFALTAAAMWVLLYEARWAL
ncbi:A24 family peptidase [Pendulispora rubella]|uniref:A24 family peptidase n=2 Tax=Pendulispora rubella TaxID=2741070 RepID=A0ABZ2KSQ8_9BACT